MNRVGGFISGVACFFFSIVLFVVIVIYLGLLSASKIVTRENVSMFIQTHEMVNFFGTSESSFMTTLYEIAEESYIEPRLMDNVVNSKEFKQLIGDYCGQIVDKLLYDGKVNNITSSQIVNIIEDTIDQNMSDLGYNLTVEEKNLMLSKVREKAQEIVELIPTYEQIADELGVKSVKTLRSFFSQKTRFTLIAVIAFITGIIALLRRSIYRFAIWTGITTIMAGGIIAFGGYIIKVYLLSLPSQFLLDNVSTVITNTGITTVIIGIIQIVYYIIMRKSLSQQKC